MTVLNIASSINIMNIARDPSRLSIMEAISQAKGKRLYVGAICQVTEKSQPAISHHLALMMISGVVEKERDGKRNYYSLTSVGKKIIKFIQDINKESE